MLNFFLQKLLLVVFFTIAYFFDLFCIRGQQKYATKI